MSTAMELGPQDNLEYLRFALRQAVSSGYSDLEYHNLEHAQDTVDYAITDAKLCISNGLQINTRVLIAAGYYHDIDYHLKLGNKFSSKEARSAARAAQELPNYGYSKDEIELVSYCIMATKVGEPCDDIHAKIIRRADLANIAGDSVGFIENSQKLLREQFALNEDDVRLIDAAVLKDFFSNTISFLNLYLQDDLSYGDFDTGPEGFSFFKVAAEANIYFLGRLKELLSSDS